MAGNPQQQKKLHPFFIQGSTTSDNSQTNKPIVLVNNFIWKNTIAFDSNAPAPSCLHGIYRDPSPSSRIAVFDLDQTLINTKSGAAFPKGSSDWTFAFPTVSSKIKQAHADGYTVVLLSNQNIKGIKLTELQTKVPYVAQKLDVPLHFFAALEKDQFRKPLPGMWIEFERNWNGSLKVDYRSSYFIGDAAGRPKDHSDVDRKLALNTGLPFKTPEEYFLNQNPTPYTLSGLDNPDYLSQAPTTWEIDPEITRPPANSTSEIVLFSGYPGSGKSSFFKRCFEPLGYERVNQDTLGSRPKCVKAVLDLLEQGKSCVVDNTNRDVATRATYIELAKKYGAPVRLVQFTASPWLSYHSNIYRAFFAPPESRSPLIPIVAYSSYAQSYEPPTLEEGYTSMHSVNPLYHSVSVHGPQYDRYWKMRLSLGAKQERCLDPSSSSNSPASGNNRKRKASK